MLSLFESERINNVITAITNITCIFPIYKSFMYGDWITTGILSFVSIASIISHLVENHKHGMIGCFDVSNNTSSLLNRIDVVGSVMTFGRLLYLYYQKYSGRCIGPIIYSPWTWFMMFIPFLFLMISEHDKYNPRNRKLYVVTHSVWHLSVFASINYFLNKFIYS